MRFFTLLFVFSTTFAFSKTTCRELAKVQTEIYVNALNIENVHTTRTLEGGPYKKRAVRNCTINGCDILELDREQDYIEVYNPGHPDANQIGYVKKPNIDLEDERASLKANIAHLRSMGKSKKCGLKIDDFGDSVLVKYPSRHSVKADVINLDSSIVRTWKNGKKEIVNFIL